MLRSEGDYINGVTGSAFSGERNVPQGPGLLPTGLT